MDFHVITIFPDIISEYLKWGMVSRALSQDLFGVSVIDLRNFSDNKYRKIDKPVYGHGKGMLFSAPPLNAAINSVSSSGKRPMVVHLTPQGIPFNNRIARELATQEDIVLIASRYEGIDARVTASMVDLQVSVGDYVLTGGELPALIMIDAISRFIPGAVKTESVDNDSFENGLIEHEHYTEPLEYDGMDVPDVLLSGNHAAMKDFREARSFRNTFFSRPDLLLNWDYPFESGATENELKRLKKKNKQFSKYLKYIEKSSKEWRNVRRKES